MPVVVDEKSDTGIVSGSRGTLSDETRGTSRNSRLYRDEAVITIMRHPFLRVGMVWKQSRAPLCEVCASWFQSGMHRSKGPLAGNSLDVVFTAVLVYLRAAEKTAAQKFLTGRWGVPAVV